MTGRAAALVGFVVVATLPFGCRPPPLRPEMPTAVPDAQTLVDVLDARRAATASLKGFARITYSGGGKSASARHAVILERPASFRLEVLSPIGTVAVVTSDSRDLAVYVRRDSRVYRGPASAESTAAYAGVPLEPTDAVDILLGSPPARAPVDAVARRDTEGRIVLDTSAAAGTQYVWFAADTLLPVASETPLADGRTLRIRFDDFRDIDGFAFPHEVEMKVEPGDAEIRVRWSSATLDAPIAGEVFAIPTRSGVIEEPILAYPAAGVPS